MGIHKLEASVGLARVVRILLEGSNSLGRGTGAAEAVVFKVASRIQAGDLHGA